MLTREQILASKTQRKRIPVIVPAWGGRVFVRELSAAEMDLFEASFAEERQAAEKAGKTYKPNVRAKMLVACVCTEDGEAVFQPGDEVTLSEFAAHEIEAAVVTADRINHFTKAHREELEKKYETAGEGGSATD